MPVGGRLCSAGRGLQSLPLEFVRAVLFPDQPRTQNYLLYFFLGAGVGAYGIDRGLLAPNGKLARRWPLWSGAAVVAFGLATGVGLAALTAHLGSRPWEIAGETAFVVSCAASSCAFLGLFARFARTRRKIWDSLRPMPTESTWSTTHS